MTVTEKDYNIICLEYRQDSSDKDYGSCMYARFYFNLDKYEITIISDCGNYGYKWVETPTAESFLQLIGRMDSGYLLDKIAGIPSFFDYDATKSNVYDKFGYDDDEVADLDKIFEIIEDRMFLPDEADDFIVLFNSACDECYKSYDDYEVSTLPVFTHTPNQRKIAEVFEKYIQPKVCEMIRPHECVS